MANGTIITLGGVDLGRVSLSLPLFLGAMPRTVMVRVNADLYPALAALPRVVSLDVTTSEEDASATPAHATTTLANRRITEVRKVDDHTAEVYLSDCRDDLQYLVCPADFNLRWRDGYLHATGAPTLEDAIAYLRSLLPAFDAVCSTGIFDRVPSDTSLPDGLPVAGMSLPRALDLLADAAGCDVGVNYSGYLYFASREGNALSLPVGSYNWSTAAMPSWVTAARVSKSLPKTIRLLYPEKHALRLVPYDPRSTATASELRVELEQVYAYGSDYLTLAGLLSAFDLLPDAITADQVTQKKNTENFEGTALAPVNAFDTSTQELIQILKRDHDSLFRLIYPDGIGRLGGWQNIRFGYYPEVTDKDGTTRYVDDVGGHAVKCDWTEYLAKAESQEPSQTSLEGAVVARSHPSGPQAFPPDAPFAAAWVNEEAGVLRVAPAPREATAQAMWLRGLASGYDLRVTREDASVDDEGNVSGNIAGLRFPQVSDVVLSTELRLRVFAVAERRLPNNAMRWTAVDVDGFAGGGIEVMAIEVADNLFAIRDYTGDDRAIVESDGLGAWLNLPEVKVDAERRARVVRDQLAATVAGEGSVLGAQAIADFQPGGAIRETSLEVDGIVVMTTVRVGPCDNEAARQQRARRRAASRHAEIAGKVIAI